jgi:hypothetical protein
VQRWPCRSGLPGAGGRTFRRLFSRLQDALIAELLAPGTSGNHVFIQPAWSAAFVEVEGASLSAIGSRKLGNGGKPSQHAEPDVRRSQLQRALADAQARVHTIAQVYDRLYGKKSNHRQDRTFRRRGICRASEGN